MVAAASGQDMASNERARAGSGQRRRVAAPALFLALAASPFLFAPAGAASSASSPAAASDAAVRRLSASDPLLPEQVRVAAADPFSALVGKDPALAGPRPAVERYAIASDGRAFLVEGRIGEARLQFLCAESDPRLDCSLDPFGPAEEIYAAAGARGPRGDVIYKDPEGETLLRLMPYGGATVFWPGRRQGEAAARAFGEDAALNLPPANHQDALRRAARATQRLSALTGGSVLFDAGAPAPAALAARSFAPAAPTAPSSYAARPAAASASETADAAAAADAAVLADAIVRAAAGMAAVAADPTGARILGERIGVVRFQPGHPPRLSVDGRVLTVIYNPEAGVAGRPSSRAVTRFLEESL
jgi:hypothetical protein